MHTRFLGALSAALYISIVTAVPRLLPREFNSIPGSYFTENGGLKAAVEGAPVWLFGRSWNRTYLQEPCYPESAVTPDGKPNPGTDIPLTADPGDDCTDPGPYNGRFSPGIPFPNYITAFYCGFENTWRVKYDIYYVHDGDLGPGGGHKHDWEGAMVVWKEDPGDADMWHRDRLVLSQHSGHASRGWGEIQSVDGVGDVKDDNGKYRKHPKVYAGFFKHANFFDKKTSMNVYFPGAGDSAEFRSNDWYYLPEEKDLVNGEVIPREWKFGDADSTPATTRETTICQW
ncbi:MAG: hypothetical protein M1816_008052 [Peltula sp. TS41687]|nr:MAG: hypothetical protein M1816_008052 [Peltula sp. TS41687]